MCGGGAPSRPKPPPPPPPQPPPQPPAVPQASAEVKIGNTDESVRTRRRIGRSQLRSNTGTTSPTSGLGQ